MTRFSADGYNMTDYVLPLFNAEIRSRADASFPGDAVTSVRGFDLSPSALVGPVARALRPLLKPRAAFYSAFLSPILVALRRPEVFSISSDVSCGASVGYASARICEIAAANVAHPVCKLDYSV